MNNGLQTSIICTPPPPKKNDKLTSRYEYVEMNTTWALTEPFHTIVLCKKSFIIYVCISIFQTINAVMSEGDFGFKV